MDRSEVKKFSLILGGGGGLFCHKNQSCLKLPEMDRSEVKKIFPHPGGRGLFCHKNQSCSKLPEMDRSEVKKFSSSWGGGGGFSATKTKVARNCLKWIDLKSKNFPSSWGGGFSATKTKVARNCLKWIDLKSKNFPSSWGGGLFCHKNQSCSKLPEMDRSEVKKFSLILGEGGCFSATKTKVRFNDA